MYMVSAFDASGPEAINNGQLDSEPYVFGSDCEDMLSVLTQIAEAAVNEYVYNHYAICDLVTNQMFLFITHRTEHTLSFEKVLTRPIDDVDMTYLRAEYDTLRAASYAN